MVLRGVLLRPMRSMIAVLPASPSHPLVPAGPSWSLPPPAAAPPTAPPPGWLLQAGRHLPGSESGATRWRCAAAHSAQQPAWAQQFGFLAALLGQSSFGSRELLPRQPHQRFLRRPSAPCLAQCACSPCCRDVLPLAAARASLRRWLMTSRSQNCSRSCTALGSSGTIWTSISCGGKPTAAGWHGTACSWLPAQALCKLLAAHKWPVGNALKTNSRRLAAGAERGAVPHPPGESWGVAARWGAACWSACLAPQT